MAGKLVVDTIDTDNAFITLNVQQSLIATMNVSGIYSNTGVQMIGANGTVSNTAITGNIVSSQITSVANTQITGNIASSQITSNPTLYGNVSVTGVIGVGAATPSTSGVGITFPATFSNSTNANTLDDYEEGNWTPTITGTTAPTVTYNTRLGRYRKIGSQVTVSASIQVNSCTGGSGNFYFTGLPFQSFSPDVHFGGSALLGLVNWGSGRTQIMVDVGQNSTNVYLYALGTNVGAQGIALSEISTTDDYINFNLTYFSDN